MSTDDVASSIRISFFFDSSALKNDGYRLKVLIRNVPGKAEKLLLALRQVAALLFDNSAQASDSIDSTSQANFIYCSINVVNGKLPGGIEIIGDGAVEKEFVLGKRRDIPKTVAFWIRSHELNYLLSE